MELPKGKEFDFIHNSIKKKESKRTTLKLSQKGLEAFDWISNTYHISAKETLDLLCSSDEIEKFAIDSINKDNSPDTSDWTRKTFVTTEKTLAHLNHISELHGLSRNVIVEKLILIYKGLLEKQREEEQVNEEKALEVVASITKSMDKTMNSLIGLLGKDHPICTRFSAIQIITENLYDAILAKNSSGAPIDPDFLSQN